MICPDGTQTWYTHGKLQKIVKNGIVVNNNASEEQITSLMVNLLKVSKSYFEDLNNFITNPSVVEALSGGIQESAQYYSSNGDDDDDIFAYYEEEDPVTESAIVPTTKAGGSWFTSIKENLGGYLSDGIKLITQMDKNKADVKIAEARVKIAQAGGGSVNVNDEKEGNTPPVKKTSTTTIVVVSIVGVAVIGAIIYFVTRPKKM
jgi:hypothetical protein